MICTDKLLEGIKKNCSQMGILRGFSGKIVLRDWRGYNKYSPDSDYKDFVELEAIKVSILPSFTTHVRVADIRSFKHTLTFKVQNLSQETLDTLPHYMNTTVIPSLELEDGTWLSMFSNCGCKMSVSGMFHGASNGEVMFECLPSNEFLFEDNAGIYTDDFPGYNDIELGYGLLYSGYVVVESENHGGLLEGFTVPTNEHINSLLFTLANQSELGGVLKSTLTEPSPHPRWDSPNTGATNEVNFSALPAGLRGIVSNFEDQGTHAHFWTSTEVFNEEFLNWRNFRFSIRHNSTILSTALLLREAAQSIRCVRPLTSNEQLLANGTMLPKVVDASGNRYNVVKIEDLAWTVENLQTTKFVDGTSITDRTGSVGGTGLDIPYYTRIPEQL